MRKPEKNKGFTLVEVLIAVAILAVLVVPLVANFVTSSRVNLKSKRVMNGTSVAQNIMEGLSSYGVENAIVQLEDNSSPSLELLFMPDDMQPSNWGKANIKYTTSTDASGKTIYTPTYANDRYLDNDNTPLLQMESLGSGIYLSGTNTVDASYITKYIQTDSEGKAIFKPDDDLHAYMFWMQDVKYANEEYDILVTFDANDYRGAEADTLDTTKVDVSGYTSREDLQDDISDTANSLHKDRNYNSVKLAEITNSIGTDAAENDSILDRYYMEESNAFSNAVTALLMQCVPGTTEEQLRKNIIREIYIDIRNEANIIDASKPYTVIGVKFKYTIDSTSGLASSTLSSTYEEAERIIFKSCENLPRNVFFYYIPNYAPTDTGITDAKEKIYISNTAGVSEGSNTYGTEINLYIIRECQTLNNSSEEAAISVQESKYKVDVYLNETLKDGNLENIKTNIFTNIDYDIAYDTEMTGGIIMGNYYLNGIASSANDLQVDGLDGKNYRLDTVDEEDYLYTVTIQVFRAGSGFKHEARVAKFVGSSN